MKPFGYVYAVSEEKVMYNESIHRAQCLSHSHTVLTLTKEMGMNDDEYGEERWHTLKEERCCGR